MADAVHDAERLKELQSLPLDRKIQITQTRIIEWYQHYNGKVCVSFSGGKDSTVLLHIARNLYPDIPAVFSNTGLEYASIQRFVKKQDNVDIIVPSMRFDEVISTYGYPLIGKEVAEAIYYARRIRSQTGNVERERERRRSNLQGQLTESERNWKDNESRQKQKRLRGQVAGGAEVTKRLQNGGGGYSEPNRGSASLPTDEFSYPDERCKKQTNCTDGSDARRRYRAGVAETNLNIGGGVHQPPNKGYGPQSEWRRIEFQGKNMGNGLSRAEQRRIRAGIAQTGQTGEGGVFSNPVERFGTKSQFNKEKWLPLARDVPILISHYCCFKMKKSPMKKYQHEHKYMPILATLAEESRVRKQAWIRHGCNAFESSSPTSQPMSFWTEQDVLAYIVKYGLEIASVYGDIVSVGDDGNVYPARDVMGNSLGKLKCTGCQRTGCVYCAFGAHLDKGETRFQQLAKLEPRKYEYAIGGGQWSDNPYYDPAAPEYDGEWKNWNPKKIWTPSKKGLGLEKAFDMVNEIYGENFIRYE